MSSVDYDDVCKVQVKILNENKLSRQKISIPPNDIRKILSEIEGLDKEILEIGKSNIKRDIKIVGLRSGRVCLIHLKTIKVREVIEVWIPITELGKLRCQLMEPIYNDYNDYVANRIDAANEINKNVECDVSLGVNEKYKEYGEATEILKKYDEWAAAVKEQKKCQQEALRTKEACKKAEEFYQKVKKEEEIYNSEIKQIVTIFSAIIPDLACFAGCRTSELYPDIAASLENKRRHLKAYRYRNKGVLDDLKEIPSFPDLETMQEDSDMEQNGLKEDDANAGIPEEVREFIDKLRNLFECGSNLNNGNFEETFDSIWNNDKASETVAFLRNGLEEAERALPLTQEEKDIGENERIYRMEAEKIKKRILSYDKHWCYARLFCMAYPIVKEIDEYPEGEMDADWCRTISERLYQLLEDFNKESGKYWFQWILYNDKECIESESIKVDFVAGEARWPGLYLGYKDDSHLKHLICITPGSVLGV